MQQDDLLSSVPSLLLNTNDSKLSRRIGRYSRRMWFLFHIWNTWHSRAVRVKWKRSSPLNVFFRVNCIKHKRFKVAKTTHVHMWQTTQTHTSPRRRIKNKLEIMHTKDVGIASTTTFMVARNDLRILFERQHRTITPIFFCDVGTCTHFHTTVRSDIVIKMPSTNETLCVCGDHVAGSRLIRFFFGCIVLFSCLLKRNGKHRVNRKIMCSTAAKATRPFLHTVLSSPSRRWNGFCLSCAHEWRVATMICDTSQPLAFDRRCVSLSFFYSDPSSFLRRRSRISNHLCLHFISIAGRVGINTQDWPWMRLNFDTFLRFDS